MSLARPNSLSFMLRKELLPTYLDGMDSISSRACNWVTMSDIGLDNDNDCIGLSNDTLRMILGVPGETGFDAPAQDSSLDKSVSKKVKLARCSGSV